MSEDHDKARAFRAEVDRLRVFTSSIASSGNSKAWSGFRRLLLAVLLIAAVSSSLTALFLPDLQKHVQPPVAALKEVSL